MGHDRFYVEKLLYLENCFCTFMPYENTPSVNYLPAKKAGHITFGSLHTLTRLNAQVIDLWSALLRTLASSRLCIIRNTLVGSVRERLYTEFETRGISRARIDMQNTLPPGGHMALFHDIDISLDTFPWSGPHHGLRVVVDGRSGGDLLRRPARWPNGVEHSNGSGSDRLHRAHARRIYRHRAQPGIVAGMPLRDLRRGCATGWRNRFVATRKAFTKRLKMRIRRWLVGCPDI